MTSTYPVAPERRWTVLRLPKVLAKTGLGRSTLYAQMAEGVFPPNIAIGVRARAWVESEVDAVLAARAIGTSATALKNLVEELVAARARSHR